MEGGYTLFELVELLTHVNAQILRALSGVLKTSNISVTELIILWKINKKGPCKVTDLARKTGVPASTLTSLFDRLEKKGFVKRIHDEKDRRSILIQGTDLLENMIDTVIEEADEELKSLLSSLPEGFLESFINNLEVMQQYLEDNMKK